MMLRWLLASLHLLALGIGFGAVWARSVALHATLDAAGLRRVFAADMWWGVAAVLWIATGLLRAFGGFEKGTAYYLHNSVFLAKMGLLVLILVLEVWPMLTLIRWRQQVRHGASFNTAMARPMARISVVQAGLILLMVFAAAAMARGYGMQAG
jgi:putative membrane protein